MSQLYQLKTIKLRRRELLCVHSFHASLKIFVARFSAFIGFAGSVVFYFVIASEPMVISLYLHVVTYTCNRIEQVIGIQNYYFLLLYDLNAYLHRYKVFIRMYLLYESILYASIAIEIVNIFVEMKSLLCRSLLLLHQESQHRKQSCASYFHVHSS